MTLTEDMAVEARRLVNLLEDPQPGLATWQQAVNEVMSRLADLYFPKEAPVEKKEPVKEPNFLGRVRKQHVEITFMNGRTVKGTLLKYNRYELLFLEDTTIKKPPYIIMKHAVSCIMPLGGNPFEPRKEAEIQEGGAQPIKAMHEGAKVL